MSSPLPVPSKAALRALRGLVLGTSCTLALITEDRRRRIDHALKILENGERVKSARNYRAGGGEQLMAASVSALEDGAAVSFDPTFFRLHPQPGPAPRLFGEASELMQDRTESTTVPTRRRRDETAATVYGNVEPEQTSGHVRRTASSQQAAVVTAPDPFSILAEGPAESKSRPSRTSSTSSTPDWGIKDSEQGAKAGFDSTKRPESVKEFNLTTGSVAKGALPAVGFGFEPAEAPLVRRQLTIQKYAFPSNVKIVARIHTACAAENRGNVASAVRNVLMAYDAGVAPGIEDEEWITACALLCRTCQNLGYHEDATKLLTQVLGKNKKISEKTYFAFRPVPLITSLLEQVSSAADRETSLEIMNTCVALFTPKFSEKTEIKSQELFELGKSLMEKEFKLDRLSHILELNLRCGHVAEPGQLAGFTEWVIDNLRQRGGYKQAVRLFYNKFLDMSPAAASLDHVCGAIVECVEAAHNYKPEMVLQAMIKLAQSSKFKLRAEWVMRLLTCHWKSHGSLEGVEDLFNQVMYNQLIKFHPYAVCRVMVEIALEAGDAAKVEHYIATGTALDPEFAQHPSLMGRLALFDAKIGNWEAVRRSFAEMDTAIGKLTAPRSIEAANKARSNSFVPILKLYAGQHTIQETEQYLRLYIDQLGVPLSPWMVPLVAKHYTALRDFNALSKWLLYCAAAVPKVTAEFGNAILSSCRQANLPFPSLRALFDKLKAIHPDFVDRVSERIVLNSALSVSSIGGRMASRRIRSLGIDPPANDPRKRRCAYEGEVRLSMKQLITCGRPGEALLVYKRALHLGMPFHVLSLRLAVLAQLQWGKFGITEDQCFEKAWELVQAAQQKGCEVDSAANLLLSKQLRAIFAKDKDGSATHGEVVFEYIQQALENCEKRGIRIYDRTLNLAGLACLEQQQAKGALLFAEQAAERVGIGRCYNSMNFRVFMLAYAELFDVDGLRDCLDRAVKTSYWVEGGCRQTLRLARLRMGLAKGVDVAGERRAFCDGIVKEALGQVVRDREAFVERRDEFGGFALEVMREAAASMAAGSAQSVADELAGKEEFLGGAPWIVGEDGEDKDWLLETLRQYSEPAKDEGAAGGLTGFSGRPLSQLRHGGEEVL